MPWNSDRKPFKGKDITESRDRGDKKGNFGKKEGSGRREGFAKRAVKSSENSSFKQHRELDEADMPQEDPDKIEGRNSVLEALKAGRTINKILISKGDKEGSIKYITALAREKGIIIQEVERTKLDSISSTRAHQGVVAYVAPKDYVEIEDILKIAEEKGEPPFIVLLDEITDPHNLGSIMRTADAVGAHGIVIPKRRSVSLTATVSKASAGAVEYVPVARVTNIAQTIEYLKKQNIWIIGTDSTGDKAFYESDLKGGVGLVIGSEGEGIGKLIREKCDFVVNIPMKGKISSLNAAVAAGVVMYEIQRQRGI